MKLFFKQRLFSWFDSFDIYDDKNQIVYTVRGQFSWGHCLKIFNANGIEVGTVKERVLSFLPRFDIILGTNHIGCISKQFSLFRPKYIFDFNGWQADGNIMEWDYEIKNNSGFQIASISKKLLNLTDTYYIDVLNPDDVLCVLMFVIAIDAEKCSRSNK